MQKNSYAQLVITFPHINDDARSKSHQISTCVIFAVLNSF